MTFLNVGALRQVISDLPDKMDILMRIQDDDGARHHMAHVFSAKADAGCGEDEVLMLDGSADDAD